MKATIRDRVVAFHSQMEGNLEFISGKWFYRQSEIKRPDRFWAKTMPSIESVTDLQNCMDMFICLYGEDGDWYESEIIKEARQQKALYPLCFDLSVKQMKIIRKLVDGDEEVCFICTGIGGSGKSTFLNIIKQIFDNDVSSCPLSELNGFNTAEALQHRLIASDELSADDLDNKTIKTIISKQTLQVNPKFEKPYQVKAQSGLFYCCNTPPRIDLDDTGLLRRIIYYEMNEKIKCPDTSLNHREWGRGELVNIVANALYLDMTNWREDFEENTRYYLLKNNSVYKFRNKTSYADYSVACYQAGLKAYSEPKWQNIKNLIKEWGMQGDKNIPMKKVEDEDPLPF